MNPVRISLLYKENFPNDLVSLGQQLSDCFERDGIDGLRKKLCDDENALSFETDGFRILIEAKQSALPIEAFDHALDGFISNARRDALAKALFEHTGHVQLRLTPTPGEGVNLSATARLRMLEAAHAVASLWADLAPPMAIHWTHSDQLVTAAQYGAICDDPTPMALFAAGYSEGQSLRIAVPGDLSERDIVIWHGATDPAIAYATGLSYLRHALTTGGGLPDGDTYGPVRGHKVEVRHIDVPTINGRPAIHLNMKPLEADEVAGRQVNAGALATIQSRLRGMSGQGNRPISRALFSTVM